MKADNYFRVGKEIFTFNDLTIDNAWRHARYALESALNPKARIVVFHPPSVRGPWDLCGIVGIGPLEDETN